MSKIIKFLKNEDFSLAILNKELYFKILFIESDSTDSILTLVDDDNGFNTLFSKNQVYGNSFNVTSFFYKNNLTNEVFFSLNVLPFYNKCGLLLKNFNKLLLCLEKRKLKKSNNNLDLIFIKVIPGGFKCVYLGILGFLPKKHFFIVFLTSEKQKKFLAKFTKNYFVNFFFNKNYFSDFLKRIPCQFFVRLQTIKFYYKRKFFIKKIKKRKKLKRWTLNIVFLSRDYFKDERFNLKKCDRKKRIKTTVYKKYVKSLSFDKNY